jgi:hypothetical protein
MSRDNSTILNDLIGNALDFISSSLERTALESDPKKSILHFAIGIELILKARLLQNDWLLLYENPDNANYDEFCAGNFKSISVESAIKRVFILSKTDKSNPTKISLMENFLQEVKEIKPIRNKLVHFYHRQLLNHREVQYNSDVLEIVSLAYRIWHDLDKIISEIDVWKSIFVKFHPMLLSIDSDLRKLDKYLQIVYEQNIKKIEEIKKINRMLSCPVCQRLSFNSGLNYSDLHEMAFGECFVCRYKENSIKILCPHCDSSICQTIEEYEDIRCDHCLKNTSFEFNFDVEDNIAASETAFCEDCRIGKLSKLNGSGYCFECQSAFSDHANIIRCDCCNTPYLTEDGAGFEDSYLHGCGNCDGVGS